MVISPIQPPHKFNNTPSKPLTRAFANRTAVTLLNKSAELCPLTQMELSCVAI